MLCVLNQKNYKDADKNDDDKNKNYITPKLRLGVIEEDGSLQPLSAWTNEPVFGTSLEFLVDDQDRILPGGLRYDPVTGGGQGGDMVTICALVPANVVSYASRQVDGGKGPRNPHGSESELLYYIEQDYVDSFSLEKGEQQQQYDETACGGEIEIVLKPHLEITW